MKLPTDRVIGPWLLLAAVALLGVGVTGGLVVAQPADVVDLNDGLVFRYTFPQSYAGDEIRDLSSEGNHGRVMDKPDIRLAESNDSIQFTGGDRAGYIRVPLNEPLEGEFSIVIRVENPPHDYHAGIVTSERWRLVTVSNRYMFATRDTSVSAEVAIEPNRWHHVTIVHQPSNTELYVDGRRVDSKTTSGNMSTGAVLIGRRPSGYTFEGRIAEVRMYHRALSTEEVRGLYGGKDQIRQLFYSNEFRLTITVVFAFVVVIARFIKRSLVG